MGRALGGKPLVLVVEDDAVTRMAAVAMLDSAGYEVVEADSGSSAVQELMRVPGIRVILTDIDMPMGIDGIKLAACVDLGWPGISIVMTSGKVKPLPGDVPRNACFVPKPYGEAKVLAAISRMMAQ